MAVACPGCGEELPEGARFCGACGRSIVTPPPEMVVCPLCRAEVPAQARFCGACGQPLYAGDSLPGASSVSLPDGMLRVPLVHGAVAAPGPPARVEEPGPVAPAPPQAEPPTLDVDVDFELEAADAHYQLVEVDALARRGELEAAVRKLLAVHGLVPGDPRLRERLDALAQQLARATADLGRSGKLGAAALRSELRRLLGLCPDPAFRDALWAEVLPVATRDDAARVREAVRDGHLHAALTLLERTLAAGPRIPELRALQHDVMQAVVTRATAEQREGDRAFRRGDAAGAAARYEEALGLLEDDRILLARLARARGG